MPEIVACPSCGGKLRIPDALRGQKVRCPTCQHIFDSAAAPDAAEATPRAPQDLPLELTLDDPSSSQPPSADVTPGLIGAIELDRSSQEPSPPLEPAPPPELPRRRSSGQRRSRDIPTIRRLGPRRDAEPDRGAAVLALGIISLALILIWCAAPVGAVLGLIAWIMGQIDLRKMKSGQMDDANRGLTQAGWICGILGTILNCLMMLGCGLFLGTMIYSDRSTLPNTRPIPATRPARPMPNKGKAPVNDPKDERF